MAVYKRGALWWYRFIFKNERIQESTKQSNEREAEQMEEDGAEDSACQGRGWDQALEANAHTEGLRPAFRAAD
jgi:hypothetical protein